MSSSERKSKKNTKKHTPPPKIMSENDPHDPPGVNMPPETEMSPAQMG